MVTRHTFTRRVVGVGVGVGTAAGLLVGCATANLDAQWVDPQSGPRSLAGARIFVVCQASDPTLRLVCADKMSAQLKSFGATPLLVPATGAAAETAGAAPPTNNSLIAKARAAGAAVLFTATVAPDDRTVSTGPVFSIGLGGYGGGRSGAGVGLGVGVPIGGVWPGSTAYSADGALTDVASGRLMWRARATSVAASDVNQQLATLAKRLLGAARSAGFFPF